MTQRADSTPSSSVRPIRRVWRCSHGTAQTGGRGRTCRARRHLFEGAERAGGGARAGSSRSVRGARSAQPGRRTRVRCRIRDRSRWNGDAFAHVSRSPAAWSAARRVAGEHGRRIDGCPIAQCARSAHPAGPRGELHRQPGPCRRVCCRPGRAARRICDRSALAAARSATRASTPSSSGIVAEVFRSPPCLSRPAARLARLVRPPPGCSRVLWPSARRSRRRTSSARSTTAGSTMSTSRTGPAAGARLAHAGAGQGRRLVPGRDGVRPDARSARAASWRSVESVRAAELNEYLRHVPLDEPLPVVVAPSHGRARAWRAGSAGVRRVVDVEVRPEWRQSLASALDWRHAVRVHGVGRALRAASGRPARTALRRHRHARPD